MTASPNRNRIDQRTPTTSFVGASPLASKPISASSPASLRPANPRSNVHPTVPNRTAAPAPGESAQLTPLAGARPIAKISIGLRLAAST